MMTNRNMHGDGRTPALRLLVNLVAIVALAAGCGGERGAQDEAEAPATAGPRVYAYDCENGSYVVASFEESDEVWLFLPEYTVRLPHVPSGSGARYTDGTITFWTRGDEAVLELGDGGTVSCRQNRLRSRIEASKLAGNDFWASGNEPGWTLEIGPEQSALVTDYGQTRHVFPTPVPTTDEVARRTDYRASSDGTAIVIRITGEPCQDSMSGESFEVTVEIQLGDQTLYGCGQALH
jgi:putative lipoprotein